MKPVAVALSSVSPVTHPFLCGIPLRPVGIDYGLHRGRGALDRLTDGIEREASVHARRGAVAVAEALADQQLRRAARGLP